MKNDTIAPKISVIMATFNRAALLPSAVDSILRQTYKDFEFLIIDDVSQDGTSKVLEELGKLDCRIKVFTNKHNLGPGPARNVCLEAARGEYIAIMDDDDISLPCRLEVQAKILDDNPSIDAVFSTYYNVDDGMNILGIGPKNIAAGVFPEDSSQVFEGLYLHKFCIVNPSAMFRRSILQMIGGYGSTSTSSDRFFFMKMAAMGFRVKAILEPLLLFRGSDDYTSHVQANRDIVLINRIKTIVDMKAWLRTRGITNYDRLYGPALSNVLLIRAGYIGGLKGLLISVRALIADPRNENTQKMIREYISKIPKRFRRFTNKVFNS